MNELGKNTKKVTKKTTTAHHWIVAISKISIFLSFIAVISEGFCLIYSSSFVELFGFFEILKDWGEAKKKKKKKKKTQEDMFEYKNGQLLGG